MKLYTALTVIVVVLLLVDDVSCRKLQRRLVASLELQLSGCIDQLSNTDQDLQSTTNDTSGSSCCTRDQMTQVLLDEIRQLKQPSSCAPCSTVSPAPTCTPNTNLSVCPENFTYESSVNGCYKVVLENLNFTAASRRCKAINSRAHLVIVDNAAEQSALARLLGFFSDSVLSTAGCNRYDTWGFGVGFYAAAQRIDPMNNTPFLYRILSANGTTEGIREMTYRNFHQGEPNFGLGGPIESCIQMYRDIWYQWTDMPCSDAYCSVCEIDVA